MEGYAGALKWLLDAETIEVPFFQRPYVWEENNFEALIDSFIESDGNTMPFFGSIILKRVGQPSDRKYMIIDGQQRITTFNVLIRAILDIKDKFGISISPTLELSLKGYAYNIQVDNDGNDSFKIKMIPSNSDRKAFFKVMDPNIERPISFDDLSNEPIEIAYKYFCKYFSENQESIKSFCLKLYDNTNSLIFIILNDKDDEQKIFDSVNSLGKPLSNSDIIKNYIFQKMKEKAGTDSIKKHKVEELYYKFWDTIFYADGKKDFWYKDITIGRIKSDNLESFLRDFGVVKGIYAAKKTTGTYGLCDAFKKHIEGMSFEQLGAFIKEINEYAEVYYEYKTAFKELNNFTWNDSLNRLLLILDYLETTTFNPYILKLLKDKPSDLENKLYNLERFFLSRFIFDGTTKNYNQCCEGLINSTDDVEFYKNYMKESPPEDKDYTVKFRRMTNKQGTLFLFLIEMLSRCGEEDKYSDCLNINSYTLEHVMPQKWQSNAEWLSLDSYTSSGEKIDKNDAALFIDNRNEAVRSLGNFALLTSKLNSSVSNSSFEIKINGNGKKGVYGIRRYAASLSTAKAVIEEYDKNKLWDERTIYGYEFKYYQMLNNFYCFETNL